MSQTIHHYHRWWLYYIILFILFFSQCLLPDFPLMDLFCIFQPDRIKQFGAVNRRYDNWRRDVPYKPGLDLEAVGKDSNPRLKDDKPTKDTEQRGPSGKSHVDYSTALSQLTGKTVPGSRTRAKQGVPSLDYFNEDYHRDFSNILGEVAIPRYLTVALCSYTWMKWATLL